VHQNHLLRLAREGAQTNVYDRWPILTFASVVIDQPFSCAPKARSCVRVTRLLHSIALPTTGHRDSYRILVLTCALFTRVAGEELSVLHQTRLIDRARKASPRYQLNFSRRSGLGPRIYRVRNNYFGIFYISAHFLFVGYVLVFPYRPSTRFVVANFRVPVVFVSAAVFGVRAFSQADTQERDYACRSLRVRDRP